MEELYKVMDDLLEVEFQMKAGMDILKELEEFYMLEKETEKSDARKVAVLMKGYLQSMKSNIREIIRYIDDTTLEKSNDKKKDKQESASTISRGSAGICESDNYRAYGESIFRMEVKAG